MFRKCSGPFPCFTDTPDIVGKTENRPGAPGTPLITKITQTSTKPKKNLKYHQFHLSLENGGWVRGSWSD